MNPRVSDAPSFALMLEKGCEAFTVLDSLLRGESRIFSQNIKATPCVQMALAQSFIFYIRRAYRICKGSKSLKIPSAEKELFLTNLADIRKIRDVNEHGFDPDGPNKRSKPSMHVHQVGGMKIAVDETSLVVLPGHIKVGPLNLYDAYSHAERMRRIAGFASLATSAPGL